jgi:hypothetical protein
MPNCNLKIQPSPAADDGLPAASRRFSGQLSAKRSVRPRRRCKTKRAVKIDKLIASPAFGPLDSQVGRPAPEYPSTGEKGAFGFRNG